MPTELPIDASAPNYRVGTTIEGVQYLLDVRWDSRAAAWFLDVLDVEAIVIAAGLKLCLGVIIGRRCADPRFPAGGILVSDLSGDGLDATLGDLGSRVKVYHYTVAELEALE